MIQVNAWAVLSLTVYVLIVLAGAAWAAWRFFMRHWDATLNKRFGDMEKARAEGQERWVSRFGALDQHLDEHRERIYKLELASASGQVPSLENIAELHDRVTELSKDVSKLSGEFSGAKHTLELIHSFLLASKGVS